MGKKTKRPNRQGRQQQRQQEAKTREQQQLTEDQRRQQRLEALLSPMDLAFPFDGPDRPDMDNPREIADFCRKNFLALSDSDMRSQKAVDLFCNYMIYAIHSNNGDIPIEQTNDLYFTYFDSFQVTRADIDTWRKIMLNESQPIFLRVNSYWALGLFYYHEKKDYVKEAACYEKMRNLSKQATASERSQTIIYSPMFGFNETTVGAFLDMAQQSMKNDLFSFDVVQSDGTVTSLPCVGGEKCDNCGKTQTQLCVDSLDWCNKCNMAYYCSRECQKAAWDNSHKHQCRHKGEFRPGDQVLWYSTHLSKLCNGILEESDDDEELEKLWRVRSLMQSYCIDIKDKELIRLRPALWMCEEAFREPSEMCPELRNAIEMKWGEDLQSLRNSPVSDLIVE